MHDEIDAQAEVLRYASGSHVDVEHGFINGTAFKPRASDDGKLSVNRLGVFSADPVEDLTTVRTVVAEWMTIRKSGRFAQISLSAIQSAVADAETSFSIEADPLSDDKKPNDPSHCLITGVPAGEDDGAIAIRDMIAMSVSCLHEPVEKP